MFPFVCLLVSSKLRYISSKRYECDSNRKILWGISVPTVFSVALPTRSCRAGSQPLARTWPPGRPSQNHAPRASLSALLPHSNGPTRGRASAAAQRLSVAAAGSLAGFTHLTEVRLVGPPAPLIGAAVVGEVCDTHG